MDPTTPFTLRVDPEALPQTAPYATATFTIINTAYDVTIVFMRTPIFTDEEFQAQRAKGGDVVVVKGPVVASVTLPREVAAGLAGVLASIVAGAPSPGAKP